MTDSEIRQRVSKLLIAGLVQHIEPITGELCEKTSDSKTKEAMALIQKAIQILNPDDPFILELERTLYKTAHPRPLIDCDCEGCEY